MIKNSSKLLFLFMIIFSTLMIFSSYSWFMSWVMLEVNLISFISFMLKSNSYSSVESSIIYFFFQTIASILFLFSLIYYLTNMNFWSFYLNIYNNLIIITLMIKIGSAPFHFWVPLVSYGINWKKNYLLLTWQKLGPLLLIWNSLYTNFINLFIFLSALIGMIAGLNQTSLKKMMAFSSINQISWMLMILMKSKFMWKIFMSIYFFITFSIIILCNNLNVKFLSQLYTMKINKLIMLFLFFNFFSMGGLPPFLGFFPKMLIIMLMYNNLLMVLLIILTLGSLFFYIRIMYFSMFLNNKTTFNMLNINKMSLLMNLTYLTNFILLTLLI